MTTRKNRNINKSVYKRKQTNKKRKRQIKYFVKGGIPF